MTVAEAMWKGTPVIGGNVGGIRYQINNNLNGFLVSSVEEAAKRIVQLLKDGKLRERWKGREGNGAREVFADHYLEQYLDLFNSFETLYHLDSRRLKKGR